MMSSPSSSASLLLRRQLKQMQSAPDLPGISVGLADDNNILDWEVMLMISDELKYYGGMDALGLRDGWMGLVCVSTLANSTQAASSRPGSRFPPSTRCCRPRCVSRRRSFTRTVCVPPLLSREKKYGFANHSTTTNQSTPTVTSASRSSTHRKTTSMATSPPPSAGRPSRLPKRSCCPSSPYSARPTTRARPTSRPRGCGGRTSESTRNGCVRACGRAQGKSKFLEDEQSC